MKASEIREAFLSYFENRGHTRVRSGALVPANDPTLFFTNAGMVQFKDVFTGREKSDYNRACSSQKCMRVSGKHNDLENVGHTPRHHTFFEMLGNFSFGDYFKEDAIAFAWEFITKEMNLPKEKLVATVFREDDEAEKLWEKYLPKSRIFRLDEKDNFWSMGETGPCGPCSEIHWDFKSGDVTKEDLESGRFMEIWNLVFMQFNRSADGSMAKLARPSIDTGMGLERLSAVMQGVGSNWETDLFIPIINQVVEACTAKKNLSPSDVVATRVVADHARASAFLIADGVLPSNEGRGYVLRRIMRRAIRFGKQLGVTGPFMAKVVPVVIDEMGGAYPELATHQHFIEKVITSEEERFLETLDKGLELLKHEMSHSKQKTISGAVAFKLYDTFGFPLDVTRLVAADSGYAVDEAGFEAEMEKQRERARANWKGSGEESVSSIYKDLAAGGVKSEFVGYTADTASSRVVALIENGRRVGEAGAGSKVAFVSEKTPFYGESGGQVGDKGVAVVEGVEIEITSTKKPVAEITVHEATIKKGAIKEGMTLTLAIDSEARQATRCNHTTTHLLHRALREVLGEHVKQAGSLVGPSRLRFDFAHFKAMEPSEIREVERLVNESIRKNYRVTTSVLSYDEAVAKGAIALFGEKYGDEVRLVEVEGFSKELCGGTHVAMTGEIGAFKIISESSVAAGVRRIEAVTAAGALDHFLEVEKSLGDVAALLKVKPSEAAKSAKRLSEEVSRLERELKNARSAAAKSGDSDLMSSVRDVGGVKVVAGVVDSCERTVLAELAEHYRDKLVSGVVLLATEQEGKVTIIAAVSKDLTGKVRAGDLVKRASEVVGGKGGGRPDFAQGGGLDASKMDEAIKAAVEMVGK